MPPVVVAVATAVSAAAANTAAALGATSAVIEAVSSLTYSAVAVGVSTGAIYGLGAALAPKLPDPVSLQTPLKQPMPVRQSAFGRVRVAGSYALYTVGTTNKHISYDVLALLDGQSAAVVSFYLNDDLMAPVGAYWYAPGAPGKYGGGGSNPPNLVKLDSRLGLSTETPYAISGDVPEWDADHRGDGVTSMLIECTQAKREDQSGDFPNGLPTGSAVIDTQLVFDPRDAGQVQGDPSTYKYSDNPVLCLLAYLTDASGGMGLDFARFIAPTIDFWIDAANECDGFVATSGMHATLLDAASAGDHKIFVADQTGLAVGTVITLLDGQTVTVSGLAGAGEVDFAAALNNPHSAGELTYWNADGQRTTYRCAGTYPHDAEPGDVIKQILSTFDGWLGPRGDGALVVRTNTPYSPSVTLNDRHVTGYQLQRFLPDEQAVNQLIVSYTDPAGAFSKAEAGYVEDDDDIAARGRVRSRALDLAWAPSGPQAITVAEAQLARLNQALRGVLFCNLAGLAVLGHRFVKVQITEQPSLNDLVIEVTGKVSIDVARMTVSFPFVATDLRTISSPAAVLPPLGAPSGSPLQSLVQPTITSVTPVYPNSGGGVQGARASIVVADPGGNITWKVQWKLSSDSAWTDAGSSYTATGTPLTILTGLIPATGSVDFQVAYIAGAQVSPWSMTTAETIAAASIVPSAAPTAGAALVVGPGYMYDDTGTAKVVNADAAVGDPTSASYKPCNCWINAVALSGAAASVTMAGQYVSKAGLSPGATYWLQSGGGVAATAPSTSGNLDQVIGTADDTGTKLFFSPQRGIGV